MAVGADGIAALINGDDIPFPMVPEVHFFSTILTGPAPSRSDPRMHGLLGLAKRGT